MNKLVYIFVPNEFVIGQVVLKSFIKRLAVAMVNKTVVCIRASQSTQCALRLHCAIHCLDYLLNPSNYCLYIVPYVQEWFVRLEPKPLIHYEHLDTRNVPTRISAPLHLICICCCCLSCIVRNQPFRVLNTNICTIHTATPA
jgi:hypothetical protein